MGSWDRMVVPLPFSQAVFLYGEPISIARDDDVEAARVRLESAILAAGMELKRGRLRNRTQSDPQRDAECVVCGGCV